MARRLQQQESAQIWKLSPHHVLLKPVAKIKLMMLHLSKDLTVMSVGNTRVGQRLE